MKLTVTEKRVLRVLLEREPDVCTSFVLLGSLLDITQRAAKIACRKLARRGLVKHLPYWWTDEGKLEGTGYCLTVKGVTEARWVEELGDAAR